MTSKISLIIGAGQLGSRHMQGLLKSKINQVIYIFDVSDNSLLTAKERSLEIDHNHQVIFTNKWLELPICIDFAIISTNSNRRFEILNKLLNRYQVKNILLEKVLFQSIREYKLVQELNNKYPAVNLWVNHPRRISSFYHFLKNRISADGDSIKSVNVTGIDWGLACNSLHFIDLISFLTGEKICDFSNSFLDKSLTKSKRQGYIEFHGTLTGSFFNKVFVSLTSSHLSDFKNIQDKRISIFIETNKENIMICEGANCSAIFQNKYNLHEEKIMFDLKLQSELTTDIANDIYSNKHCLLPKFNEADDNHRKFVSTLLKHYNKIQGSKFVKLPIT
jgi:predicted dehydrogenase